MSRPFSTHSTGFERGRGVTAVLGPTNTGKTHLAIERMLAHDIGIIGLPLRLLAREVYDKIVGRAGAAQVALITGEEKIKPPSPRFYVCTVEAMPLELEADFVAVDEIQLAADGEVRTASVIADAAGITGDADVETTADHSDSHGG